MIRVIFGVLALCLSLLANHAQAAVTAPDPAFERFISNVTAPGKQTVSFGSNGTPVVAPGVPSLSSSGGSLQVARTGSLPLSGGARLPVTATAKISSSAAASIIKKALPLVPYIGPAVSVLLLAHELGFDLSNDPVSGAVVVTKPDISVCSVAPCNVYAVSLYGQLTNPLASGYKSSKALACEAARASWDAVVAAQYKPVGVQVGATVCTVFSSQYGWTKLYDHSITAGTVTPSAPVFLPSSSQEFADAIASSSGWPSSSAIAQAVVDAQKITGDVIPTDQPDVAGPASVDGPVETTTSGNKVTTKKTTFNCTYDNSAKFGQYGGSASCAQKTTTTDTIPDPVTGNPITTPIDETVEPVDPVKEDGPAIDTALPGQPTLYKRQYPDGLTGVWNSKKAELLATPLLQLTSNLQPTIAAPSGYPTWPVPVVIGHWNFGTYDVSPASYVWDFLKVCTIIGALFLARALIFGG